jgi:ATP-binding cassette subfamily B protein
VRGMPATLRYAFLIVWRCSPSLVLAAIIITVLQGFSPAVTIWISKYVLDSIVAVVTSEVAKPELKWLFCLLIIQAGILLGLLVIDYLTEYVRELLGRRVRLSVETSVLQRVSELEFVHFETAQSYDTITRAKGEAGGRPLGLLEQLADGGRSLVSFVAMAGLVSRVSIPLTVLMGLQCLPYFIVRIRFSEKYYKLEYERTQDRRMAERLASTMGDRRYVAETLCFHLWPYLMEKWLVLSRRFLGQDMRLVKERILLSGFAQVIMMLGRALAVGYIVYLDVRGSRQMSVGDIVMYSGAFSGGVSAIARAFDSLAEVYRGSLFLRNLREFDRLGGAGDRLCPGRFAPPQVECIEFRNVSFKYPGAEEYAIQDVNLTIRCSETTLIVGPNGAGKTTLIKLLARLYEPTEGVILLNGVDAREYDTESLRERMAIVFQEFARYPLSARENIGCGCVGSIKDVERVIRAAKKAKAHAFVQRLPLGYETILSKEFAGGQELSLGQWQRVCLARMFMRDVPVLVFDEPTASLDVETESHLLKEIALSAQDRICVLVSHRIFRRGIADQIVVFDRGRILEQGTYEHLLAQNGRFARLCTLYHSALEGQESDVAASLHPHETAG